MSNDPTGADGQSSILNQLIAEFMTRTDAGEILDVTQFLSEHPEHATELEKYFANVDLLNDLNETDHLGYEETVLKSDYDQSPAKATNNTNVRLGTDSGTSLTGEFQRPDTDKTENAIPENFGRYAIQKVLGQGAMGAVYLARDTQLDRDVALKIPKFRDGSGVDDNELLKRFYREARAAATLRSPHICPVYDVGEIGGQHYITMAFIEGRPLKDFTKSKKRYSEKQIATTIRKLAQGLAEAHEIGVIHRDLKPANIMIDKKGEPVVMDFGLARRSSSDDVQVTQSGAILGMPAYMAPEQVVGDQAAINHQVDIYALGVIMYELITGEMPFQGNLMAILQQIALNNPTKPSDLRDNFDSRLEKICLKMMAGDQQQRYQSINDVAADLLNVIKRLNPKLKIDSTQNQGPKESRASGKESNPGLISVEKQKSHTEQLSAQKAKRSSKPAKSSTRIREMSSANSGDNKQKLLILSCLGGLIVLLSFFFLFSDGKYDVQITIDDPNITLSIDGKALNIKDVADTHRLSAGKHKLQLDKEGLTTHIEEFTVSKDGKTALRAVVVNGQLDGLLNGEKLPQIAETSPSETLQATTTGWQDWPANAPPPAIAPFDAEQAKIYQQEWADYLDTPVEYENSIGMKFRLIPPGEFMMGSTDEEIEASLKVADDDQDWQERIKSESPQHRVTLTQPFFLGVTEVTQAEYDQIMGTNPSFVSASGEGKDLVSNFETSKHPVEKVSWNDAVTFCIKLSQQEGLNSFYLQAGETVAPLEGTGYHMPTEAEWEYACRAGTTARFWSGDEDKDLLVAGWSGSNSGNRTNSAGQLLPNPFGLSDVHGNVWEWVQDSWNLAFYDSFKENPAVNPLNSFQADFMKVIRGGNYYFDPMKCRSSSRSFYPSGASSDNIGFRVVLPVEAVQQRLGLSSKVSSDTSSNSDDPTDETESVDEMSLKFDGIDDYIVAKNVHVRSGEEFCIEAWIKCADFPAGEQVQAPNGIMTSIGPYEDTIVYQSTIKKLIIAPGTTALSLNPEQYYGAGFGNASLQPGSWTHVAVQTNALGERILYVNGNKFQFHPTLPQGLTQQAFTERVEQNWPEEHPLLIGATYHLGNLRTSGNLIPLLFFRGEMREFRMSSGNPYTEKFTPEKLFQRDKQTKVLYHFDEGKSNLLKDSSGNENHAIIIGAKWGAK